MSNETKTFEVLEQEFLNNLDWNEEEGIICGDSTEILEFLENKALEIGKNNNFEVSFSSHEYPLNFSYEKDGCVDFQIKLKITEIKGITEDNYENFESSIPILFQSENPFYYCDEGIYDFEEECMYISAFYTSINYSEKLEELKNRIDD